MVSNVGANNSKKCKKKVQSVSDFRKKMSFLNLPKPNTQKSLNKNSKKFVDDSRCDVIQKSVKRANPTCHKPSTSDMREYNDKNEVCSTISVYKFDCEINPSSSNSEIVKPSLFGNTMQIGNLDRKYTRRIYRRKINHYKSLIRILINMRAKDLSNSIVQEITRFLREYDDRELSGNISATEFSNKEPDTVSESDKRNGILSSKTGGKVFEKDSTASTSKKVFNGFENFDDKSTDCGMSFGGNRESDSDATIPNKVELFDKHPKSLDKIGDKTVGENSAGETWLKKCLEPFEFDDSDVLFDSHRKSVQDENILETAKKTGRLSSSIKKEQKIRCIELEEDLSSSNETVKVSSVNNDGRKNPNSKKNEQRNSRVNEVNKKNENTAVYIPDLGKGGETSRVSLKPGMKSKKDEEADKVSKKSEAGNSNQPKFIAKSKPAGNHCSCKRTKFTHVKTSVYSVPATIEYPSSNIRKRNGDRTAAVKSSSNMNENKKISVIGEKKTTKFYSPLELKYSDKVRSKFDISNDDSSKVQGTSLLKTYEKARMRKSARVSEPLKKFSISNFTLSDNSSKNDATDIAECSKKRSKLLKIPTFSDYSIPVSIEINIAKDDLRKRSLGMNLIQSKITKYFSSFKAPKKKVPEKISNFNSGSSDFDENGNRIMKRNNTVATYSKSKSRSLPVIESDVLLKDTEKVIYLKNIHEKSQSSIPRRGCFYGVLNESETTASNQNIIYRENITSPVVNGKKKSRHNHELICIDDSNSSVGSIVPPSYSIFSDDDNCKSVIDIDKMLDTQQREDLLAPWESVNIYENINHWHEDTFEL